MTPKERPWAVGCIEAGETVDDNGQPIRREIRTRDRLALMCEVYLPVVTRLVRPAKLRTAIERQEPMLPGYLFVDLRTVPDYGAIRDEPGFLYFVGADGRPWRTTEDEIDRIRGIEGTADIRSQGKPLTLFVDGDLVRVKDGLFRDYEGEVTVVENGAIELSGYSFPVPVRWTDLANLEKCA